MLVKIILALALTAPAAAAETRVMRSGGVILSMGDTPCTVAAALATISPIYHDRFKNGSVKGPGFGFPMCWTSIAKDGTKLRNRVYVVADDGSGDFIDLSIYTESPGI